MGSAFTTCSVLFVGEGILQLLKGQSTDELGTKNFPLGFGALKDYGVKQVVCSNPDLNARGLSLEDFVIEVDALDASGIQKLIDEHDKVLNF